MNSEKSAPNLDVSNLTDFAIGHRNVSWLGNVLYMTIEGSMFGLLFMTFFFLRSRTPNWPPAGFVSPALHYATVSIALFVISLAPALWTKSQAFKKSRAGIQIGLALLAAFGVVLIVVRFLEFGALNCRWTDNAYASCIWILLGVHTGHLITECIETLVLMAISFSPRMHGIRFADPAMNSDYWYFVAGSAFLVDLVIYGATRWM